MTNEELVAAIALEDARDAAIASERASFVTLGRQHAAIAIDQNDIEGGEYNLRDTLAEMGCTNGSLIDLCVEAYRTASKA